MEKEYGWLDKARENASRFDDEVAKCAKRFDEGLQVDEDDAEDGD